MAFKSLIGALDNSFGKKAPEMIVAEPQIGKIIVNQAFLVLNGDGYWTELPRGEYELTPLGSVENDPLEGSPVEHNQVWYSVTIVDPYFGYINDLWIQRYSQQFSPIERKMILEIVK